MPEIHEGTKSLISAGVIVYAVVFVVLVVSRHIVRFLGRLV